MKERLIPDSRFKQLNKEALICGIFTFVLIAGFALIGQVFGSGDVNEYTYLFGVPLWFALAILFQFVMMGVACFLILKVFPDMSLDADDPEYDYGKGDKKK